MFGPASVSRRDLLVAFGSVGVGLVGRSAARCGDGAEDKKPPEERRERSEDPVRVCVDRLLPPERPKAAFFRAIGEDKSNDVLKMEGLVREDKSPPISEPRMAIFHSKKWAQNRKLKVKFLGGQATVRKKVRDIAEQWRDHVNLSFIFVDTGEAEARIAFDGNDGSWSYMGTDNLTIPQQRPTMNFGWLYPDSDAKTYSSVVLHEFGHLLGCIHEHQSPGGKMIWNEERVIKDCWEQMGWTAKMVREQIFERYSTEQTQFTKLDPRSIMMYPYPAYWTKNGFSTPWNTELSETDIQFMEKVYPKS